MDYDLALKVAGIKKVYNNAYTKRILISIPHPKFVNENDKVEYTIPEKKDIFVPAGFVYRKI